MVIAGLLGSVIVLLLCIGKFKPNGGAQGVCLTPGCVEVASSIISAMDPQVRLTLVDQGFGRKLASPRETARRVTPIFVFDQDRPL